MRDCATTPQAIRNPAAWVFLAGLVLVSGVGGESVAGQPGTGHSQLTATSWSASAYSRHAGGIICWLQGEDGSLRVEVGNSPAASEEPVSSPNTDPLAGLETVLNWTGEGWTLILGPDDSGTLNEWGREWRQVPPSLAQVARLVTVSFQNYPHQRPEFSFAFPTGPQCRLARIPHPRYHVSRSSPAQCEDTWHYQLSLLELEGEENTTGAGFRDGMVTRGRGTGGRGEVLSLAWFREPDIAAYGLVVSSSRRPGTLRLEPPRHLAVITPESEVFLPLWPLSQFIETR